VLQVPPESRQLPDLALEDGDRLYVPARPSTVGVFGSVFNGGSYLWSEKRSMDDYLAPGRRPDQGWPTRPSAFVIRANGSVVSNLQTKGWLSTPQRRVRRHDRPARRHDLRAGGNQQDDLHPGARRTGRKSSISFGLGIAGIVAATR